jgi:hypothetical protein
MTSNPSARSPRRGPALALSLGAVAAAAVIAASSLGGGTATDQDSGSSAQTLPPAGSDFVSPRVFGQPCAGETAGLNLTDLRSRTEVPIYAPRDGVLTGSWACGSTPVLFYDNAIEVSYEAGWRDVQIPEKWEALAKDRGGRIETVAGRSAYVNQPDESTPRRQILIVEGDTLIRLLADRKVSEPELVKIASSLELP